MTGKKLTDPVTLKRHFSVTESMPVHLVHSAPLGLRESSLPNETEVVGPSQGLPMWL